MNRTLKSYFYWTYPRGSFHYDVMVTLILAFIFITPHLWDYGDKPTMLAGPSQPVIVTGDGDHGLIITVQASDVNVPAAAPESEIRSALKHAIQPIAGDAVTVTHWQLQRDRNSNPVAWKIWAHK